MRATKTVSAVLAATLAATSVGAFAQSRDDRRDNRQERRELRQGQGELRQDRREFRQEQRQAQRQWNHASRAYTPPAVVYNQQRYGHPHYATYGAPAYAYNAPRYWSRGDRLPYDWRSRYYVVNDWRGYNGLYAPPSGYGWVQSDTGDYLLVALATGLIANLLLNR